jgi:uncharacterized membrane-anchored protein YitT (DUF2179 family)
LATVFAPSLTTFELYISAVLLNKFLAIFGAKKAVTIIATKYRRLVVQLSMKLHQGITIINSKGYYSKQSKPIIYLICTSKQLANIVPLISQIDPHALVVIEDVHSVRGKQLYEIL